MHQVKRKSAAVASAALLLAASSMLAFPDTASAETKTVQCGSQVTAKPGDEIVGTLSKQIPLVGSKLLRFDLGVVEESTDLLTGTVDSLLGLPGWLISKLSAAFCKVTVTVADTAVEPLPGVGESGAGAVKHGARQLNKHAQNGAKTLNKTLSPSGDGPSDEGSSAGSDSSNDSGSQGDSGNSDSPGQDGDSDEETPPAIAAPDSKAIGDGVPLQPAFLPSSPSAGFAPMRDYSDVPFAQAGLFAPAPGVRYGSGVPGYQPEFGILGSNSKNAPTPPGTPTGPQLQDKAPSQSQSEIAKAGQARALPSTPSDGAGPASVPVLLAVITLAGSSAALVRTWVLRKA